MLKPTLQVYPVVLTTIAHPAAAFTPRGQFGHSAVLIKHTVYVCGGDTAVSTTSSNLYTLDVSQPWSTANPPWVDRTRDAANVSVPLSADYVMWPSADGDYFYVFGGGNILDKALLLSGFAQYNVAMKTWSLPSIANLPKQRRYSSVSWNSSVAYIWGGIGDHYTGYTSDPIIQHAFDEMITFDSKQSLWSVINITGARPMPRQSHTSTMLPNGQIVIIGGRTMEQINATYVKMTYARMSDIPTFDTNTAIWNFNNATGNLPIYRRRHVAVLGIDGISIIVCCGGKDNSDDAFNDVFVLNTQTWQWSGANVVGSAPSPRRSLPSIIVNGHIILLFGRTGGDDTAISSDIGILDTRTTPFQWTTSFSPNPPVSSSIATTTTATTTTTNVLTTNGTSNEIAAGALGVVIGIICGFLAILAILFFLIIGMPWRTHAQNNPPQDPRSESSPAPSLHAIDKSEVQASNSDSCQESAPQLPVRAQGQAVDMSNPSMNSAITFSHGGTVTVVKLARRGTTTTANQSADSYSTPAGSFRPPIQSIQNRCGDQPGGSVNQQIQLAIPDTSTNFLVPPAQSLQNS